MELQCTISRAVCLAAAWLLLTVVATSCSSPADDEAGSGHGAAQQSGDMNTAEVAGGIPEEWRTVDFWNFVYQWPDSIRKISRTPKEGLELKDGVVQISDGKEALKFPDWGASIRSLSFGDVTNDGRPEALVVVNLQDGVHGFGTNLVYVYSLDSGHTPRQLLNFADGERARGGLRDLYVEHGRLVVELWGRNAGFESLSGADWGVAPAHAAEVYSKTQYAWVGNGFEPYATEQLPNPQPSSINAGYEHLKLPNRVP